MRKKKNVNDKGEKCFVAYRKRQKPPTLVRNHTDGKEGTDRNANGKRKHKCDMVWNAELHRKQAHLHA